MSTKNSQLQIRISPHEKAKIRSLAKRANMAVSAWVMAKLLPPLNEEFRNILGRAAKVKTQKLALAEMSDFLHRLSADEFVAATASLPQVKLNSYLGNYIAAMIEVAAGKKGVVSPPSWTKEIPPLDEPVFGTDLGSLRLYILLNSPAPFRSRNIFIDSSVGDRV